MSEQTVAETGDPDDLEQQAQRLDAEADAAEQEAHALESAVVNGDPNVALDDIDTAAKRGRFARLQAQGLRARRDRARERDRLAAIARLEALIVDNAGGAEADVLERFEQALEAVSAFVAATQARNAAFAAIRDEARKLDPLPAGIQINDYSGDLEVHRASVTNLDIAELVAEVSYRALRAAGLQVPSDVAKAAHTSEVGDGDHHAADRRAYALQPGDSLGPSNRLRRQIETITDRLGGAAA